MANTFTLFNQTLVSRADQLSSVFYPYQNLVASVYQDINPAEPGTIGQTINVPIPVAQTVTDVGVGDFTPTDQSVGTKAITLDKHPGATVRIRDFEQFNTPRSLIDTYIDPLINGVFNDMESKIGALLTTGNFGTAVGTNTGSLISTDTFLSAIASLQDNNMPQPTPDMVTFVNAPTVNAKILGNSAWTAASSTGYEYAQDIRLSGKIRSAYGCNLAVSQNAPASGSVGSRTFTSAVFHKYAIALASRPLGNGDVPKNLEVMQIVYVHGIPIRFMVSYQHQSGGYWLTADAGYGLAVIRGGSTGFGKVFSVAE